ncbi:MAG: zinc ribbon domain-containing protein [Acidobacteriota bacterium]
MLNCIKCQAQIGMGMNFCPRCGSAQPPISIHTAETGKITPVSHADTLGSTGATTSQINTSNGKSLSAKSHKPLLISVLVFVIMVAVGVALGLGLRNFRSVNRSSDKSSTAQPQQVSIIPEPKVIVEENSDDYNNGSIPTNPTQPEKKSKPSQETAVNKPVEKEAPDNKPIERPSEEPVEEEPRIERPPVREEVEESPYDSYEGKEQGRILVGFRLSGDAIIRIRGSQVIVEPTSGSTVSDVRRDVRDPLPAQRCKILVKNKLGLINTIVMEEPRASNGFTTVVLVKSLKSDYQEAIAAIVVRWQLSNAR